MEGLDRAAFERLGAAYEEAAIGAFDMLIEQADDARIMGMLEMAAMHEGDSKALRGSFQHQRA